MKNIQAQYQDLLEGRMSQSNFMRNVRMQFPQHVTNVSSFEDSIKILKGKRILSEAKLPAGVYGHNPNAEAPKEPGIDQLNYYQVYHGIQYELAKMPEITDENYIKARKKVVDNILKNPDAYKELQLANFRAVKEMDEDLEMKEVKKNNLADKPNGMKVMKKDVKGNTQDSLGKKEAKKAKNGKGLQHMTQTPKGKLEAFATPGKEKVMALKESILEDYTKPNETKEDIGKGSRVKKKDLKGYDAGQVGNVIGFDGDTAIVIWDKDKKAWEKATAEWNKSQEGQNPDEIYGHHIQANVLTKKNLPIDPEAEKAFATLPNIANVKGPDTGVPAKLDQIRKTIKEGDDELDAIAQAEFGMDYDQLGPNEKEWCKDEMDNKMQKDKKSKLQKLKERLVAAIKKEGYLVQTQGGVPLSAGRNDSQGITAARDLEKTTGDQLVVVNTKSGKKTQA